MYITLNNIKTYEQQHITFIGADNVARSNNNNQLVVNGAEQALEQMKYEIASFYKKSGNYQTINLVNHAIYPAPGMKNT